MEHTIGLATIGTQLLPDRGIVSIDHADDTGRKRLDIAFLRKLVHDARLRKGSNVRRSPGFCLYQNLSLKLRATLIDCVITTLLVEYPYDLIKTGSFLSSESAKNADGLILRRRLLCSLCPDPLHYQHKDQDK